MKIEITKPCWLIATGDASRVEVLRSPLVREDDSMYEPVRRFISEHALVLAAQEKFEDDEWMFGEVEVSVYTATEYPVDSSVVEIGDAELDWGPVFEAASTGAE